MIDNRFITIFSPVITWGLVGMLRINVICVLEEMERLLCVMTYSGWNSSPFFSCFYCVWVSVISVVSALKACEGLHICPNLLKSRSELSRESLENST